MDKESGLYSRTAGGKLARMIGAKTFGHIGTLDPMATGVLPIAFGDATKMIPFIGECKNKEYLFGVQFGFETDTLDITGKIIKNTGVLPVKDQVLDACKQLIGEISQIPPQYSAVHVSGRRAYELARAGKVADVRPRNVNIYELELVKIAGQSWQFRVVCGTGTYVRSLARDIAALCGTVATVDMIRRVSTNGFEIKDAVTLDFLENLYNNGQSFGEYLKPIDFGLGDIPVWNLDKTDANIFLHGGFVTSGQESGISCLWRVYHDNKFLGIGFTDESGMLKPKRVI